MKIDVGDVGRNIKGSVGAQVRNSGKYTAALLTTLFSVSYILAPAASAQALNSEQCNDIYEYSKRVDCFPGIVTSVTKVSQEELARTEQKKQKSTKTGRWLGQIAGALVGQQMSGSSSSMRVLQYPVQSAVRKGVDSTFSKKMAGKKGGDDNLYDFTVSVREPSGKVVEVEVRQSGVLNLKEGQEVSLLYKERSGQAPMLSLINQDKPIEPQIEKLETSKLDNHQGRNGFNPIKGNSF